MFCHANQPLFCHAISLCFVVTFIIEPFIVRPIPLKTLENIPNTFVYSVLIQLLLSENVVQGEPISDNSFLNCR